MTTTRARPDDRFTTRQPQRDLGATLDWLRIGALIALGGALIALALGLPSAARVGVGAGDFGWRLAGMTALYLAACALVLRTRANAGAGRWVELALILTVGLVARMVVFGSPPLLSPDAYRYAWDPHLIVHGFSPYTHTPLDPALTALRDHNIWPNIRFRQAPTIYPPAAQAMFLLAYAVAPLNIFGVKAAIEVCDALSCLLTILLLRQRGLDLRRVILYWWAPIPIIEFAFNGHVDAEAILWTLATLLANRAHWRGARVATGALLGLATLTKLYPLLFIIVFIRRRDYGLLAGLLGVLALGYAPFVPLGLGGGGFLGTYLSQRFVDQGLLLTWLDLLVAPFTHAAPALVAADLLALALACAAIALYRWRVGLSAVAGLLALSIAWVLLSPHIFPWYLGALLPLVALAGAREASGWRALTSTAWACWVFATAIPFTYLLFLPGGPNGVFPWLFVFAAAVGLTPLLTAYGRAQTLTALRRLLAPPTLAELGRLRRACLPAAVTNAGLSPEGEHIP